jgi:Tfp pilus assembly protein PilN
MITINLNLLSPEQKKDLKIKRIYFTLKELVMLFLLFTAVIAAMLTISRYILEKRLTELVNKNAAHIQVGQEVNSQISALNKKINLVYQIQKQFQPWSVFLSRLTNITPPNIIYQNIKINYSTATLELQGVAKTRQDLIKLQQALDAADFLTEINLPLTDLLPKEKNLFHIQAKIIFN